MTVAIVVKADSLVIEITIEGRTAAIEIMIEDRTAATEITIEDRTAATETMTEETTVVIVVKADSSVTEDRIEKIMHLPFRRRKLRHRSLREVIKAKEKTTIRRETTVMKMMSVC